MINSIPVTQFRSPNVTTEKFEPALAICVTGSLTKGARPSCSTSQR
jgi:hypothetical protein